MRRMIRLVSLLAGLLATVAVAAPNPPGTPELPAGKSAAPVNPLDQAIGLITQARQAYQGVRDYTCTFIKREQVKGELQLENVMLMKFRSQPYSVHFRWVTPKNIEGQEACYVAGKNNGMMRAKPVGFAGIVGWVSVDPRDPRALKTNRKPITESGVGNLIERIAQSWEKERRSNNMQLQIATYAYNNRPCTRVEAIHPNPNAGSYAYRCVIYFDKENHLPIRFEAYDWPRRGGDPKGDLLECYSWVNLRFNVGLGDQAFNY